MSDFKFHPALAISNIKNHIPIVLEMETDHYTAWAELFKLHARSHRVLTHIIPPAKGKEKVLITDEEKELWSTLDATVLQWIYATISTDLLHTIIEPDSTAKEAWDRLRDIFQEHQNSRAVALEHDFSHLKMRDYPNASAYCQRLKTLSDQLKSVGAPVSESRLVLQLVAGLTEAYKNVGTHIRQSKPLPPFSAARSSLCLEEKALADMADDSPSAMMAASHREYDDYRSSHDSGYNRGKNKQHRGSGSGRKRGGGNRGFGYGKGGRGGGDHGFGGTQSPSLAQQQRTNPHQPARQWEWMPQWSSPPCPYPAASWARPPAGPTHGHQPGLLGPCPQQVYAASVPPVSSTPTYAPTDIESAMHTMTLSPPDPNWYMDTSATSHMTSTNGFPDGDGLNEM